MSTGQKEEHVVLVDVLDRRLGIEEKLKAHSNGGKLHRAVSVFVFNSQSEIMLQQRADTKYHSPSRWSNTCCSHPLDGEMILDAAHRRLTEEMGFDCELIEVFTFTYKCHLGQGITEHELDHVMFGRYDGEPKLNSDEVKDWRWIGLNDLVADLRTNVASYSEWLVILLRGRLVPEARKFLEHPSERLECSG
jgi:isopentenyl-diphosphate delta-isomerase